MAQINISFNTESQKFDVDIDGNKLKNTVDASIFADKIIDFLGKEQDMFLVRISAKEDTDDGKTEKRETITFVSQQSTEGKQALEGGYGVKVFSNGLVEIKITSNELDRELEQQVAAYMEN